MSKKLEEALQKIADFDMDEAVAQRIIDMKTNKELGCYWFSDAFNEVKQIAKDSL
tara:strand:- start:1266 stop:1430 length:165 start_codon:yes stop_codon:yes gene_type:complete